MGHLREERAGCDEENRQEKVAECDCGLGWVICQVDHAAHIARDAADSGVVLGDVLLFSIFVGDCVKASLATVRVLGLEVDLEGVFFVCAFLDWNDGCVGFGSEDRGIAFRNATRALLGRLSGHVYSTGRDVPAW